MSRFQTMIAKLGVVFLCAAAALTFTSATLLADEFFAHGAVGQGPLGFRTEMTLASNQIDAFSLIKRFRSVQGEVSFVRADGEPMEVLVTGTILIDGSPQAVSQMPVSGGFEFDVLGPQQFVMQFITPPDTPPNALLSEVFWTRVDESDGQVAASLKFVLLRDGMVASVADVPPAQPREYHGLFAVGTAEETPQKRSGIAIANPLNMDVQYTATAFDDQFEVVATCSFELGPNEQKAAFIDEFGGAATGIDCEDAQGQPTGAIGQFEGFVQVVSDRLSVSAALLQSLEPSPPDPFPFVTISSLPTLGAEAAPAGPFLSSQLGSLGEGSLDGQVSLDSLPLSARGTIGGPRSPSITLTNGGQTIVGTINEDGGVLIGPVPDGEWTLRLEFPGFLPFQQELLFPSPPLNIDLIPLSRINPAWFAATLGPPGFFGRLFKPAQQFEFIFDVGAFERADGQQEVDRIRQVRDAFRQWVYFELPLLNIRVSDGQGGTTRLGGRSQYREISLAGPPQGAGVGSVLVSITREDTPIESDVIANTSSFEVRGSALLFNPGTVFNDLCQPEQNNVCDAPRIATAFFYSMIFLRQFNNTDPDFQQIALTGLAGEQELLSSVFTQFVANPKSFTATGLDAFYLRVLANRPAGTLITPEEEILPSLVPEPQLSNRTDDIKTFTVRFPSSPPR